MLSIQRKDGSWEGMWGICFTYGTWYVRAKERELCLSSATRAPLSPCRLILASSQPQSPTALHYCPPPLRFGVDGLVEAGYSCEDDAIKRACVFLLSKQKEDGG